MVPRENNLDSHSINNNSTLPDVVEFVWDRERRRLTWANASGLLFWGEPSLLKLRTRIFANSDTNAITLSKCFNPEEVKFTNISKKKLQIALKPANTRIMLFGTVCLIDLENNRVGAKFSLSTIDEQDSQQSRNNFLARASLEAIPTPQLICNQQGDVLSANEAARELFFFEARAITDLNWDEQEKYNIFNWFKDENYCNQTIDNCVNSGQSTCTIHIPSNIGTREYRLHFILIADGIICVLANDLTELKETSKLTSLSDSEEYENTNENAERTSTKKLNTIINSLATETADQSADTPPPDAVEIKNAVEKLAYDLVSNADPTDNENKLQQRLDSQINDSDTTAPPVTNPTADNNILSNDGQAFDTNEAPSDAHDKDQPLPALEVSQLARDVLSAVTEAAMEIDYQGKIKWYNIGWEQRFNITIAENNSHNVVELFPPESQSTIQNALNTVYDDSEMLREATEKNTFMNCRASCNIVVNRISNPVVVELIIIWLSFPDLTNNKAAPEEKIYLIAKEVTRLIRTSNNSHRNTNNSNNAADKIKQNSESINLVSSISHDIRTPLSAIIGFAEFMTRELFGPIGDERYLAYARDIRDASGYILTLVNDLLDLSSIENNYREFSFEELDLIKIIDQSVQMLRIQANTKSLTIQSSLARNLPNVVADSRSLKQIILNLLTNALKYTPQDGIITISAVAGFRNDVTLRIRNSGKGMSEIQLKKLLTPFTQGENDEKIIGEGDGFGLGLALVSSLTKQNNIDFKLESAPNEGVLAILHFPSSTNSITETSEDDSKVIDDPDSY